MAKPLAVCFGGTYPHLTEGVDVYARTEELARLITAAPLMLEALEALCGAYQTWLDDTPSISDALYAIDIAKGVERKPREQEKAE